MKTAHRSHNDQNIDWEWCTQKLEMLRRTINLLRNRLRQQAGNFKETTQSLARPVPYHVRLVDIPGKARRIGTIRIGLASEFDIISRRRIKE